MVAIQTLIVQGVALDVIQGLYEKVKTANHPLRLLI